jgi:hypothetical protein
LSILEVFLKNVQKICLVCPARKRRNGHVRLPVRSIRDVQLPLDAQYDNHGVLVFEVIYAI